MLSDLAKKMIDTLNLDFHLREDFIDYLENEKISDFTKEEIEAVKTEMLDCSAEISLNGGNRYNDFDDLEDEELGRIGRYWHEIVAIMNDEVREKANSIATSKLLIIELSDLEFLKLYLRLSIYDLCF